LEERPGKPDNHWFDCVVGATVAASTLGVATSRDGRGSASSSQAILYGKCEMRVIVMPRKTKKTGTDEVDLIPWRSAD